jgi:hypothetical protein
MDFVIFSLVLLFVAGFAIAYIIGQSATYFAARVDDRKCRFITGYNVWHIVIMIVQTICIMYTMIMVLEQFDFEWAATVPANKPLGDIIVRMFITMFVVITNYFVVTRFYIAGNKRTREMRRKMGVKPVILDDFDWNVELAFVTPRLKKQLKDAA